MNKLWLDKSLKNGVYQWKIRVVSTRSVANLLQAEYNKRNCSTAPHLGAIRSPHIDGL